MCCDQNLFAQAVVKQVGMEANSILAHLSFPNLETLQCKGNMKATNLSVEKDSQQSTRYVSRFLPAAKGMMIGCAVDSVKEKNVAVAATILQPKRIALQPIGCDGRTQSIFCKFQITGRVSCYGKPDNKGQPVASLFLYSFAALLAFHLTGTLAIL